MGARSAIWLLVVLWMCACSDPSELLIVELRTDYLPSQEFAVVRTQVETPIGVVAPDTPAFAADDFIAGRRVLELEGTFGDSAVLTVSLVRADETTLATRDVQVALSPDATAITVLITRSCEAVACPDADPNATACLGGRCVSPSCIEEAVSECGPPDCGSDEECPIANECTVGRCIAGACFDAANDALCEAGESCLPTRGCVLASGDGGMDGGVDSGPVDGATDGDGDTGSPPDTGPTVVDPTMLGPFAPPTRVSWTINGDNDPSITSDLPELYFARRGPTGNFDIWLSTRSNPSLPWGSPARVVALSDPDEDDSTGRVTRDGLSFYVARPRAGSSLDIFVATRPTRTDPWPLPVYEPELSSTRVDRGVSIYGFGTGALMHSNRDGDFDIFEYRRPSTMVSWGAPSRLDALNTGSDEIQPYVTLDGLHVYFRSDRGASDDFFYASRPALDMPFGPVMSADDLNTGAFESDLVLSDDGRYAIFQSTRGSNPGLYEASR